MTTPILEDLITDYPGAITVLDNELNITNYSKTWLEVFELQHTNPIGERLFDVLLDQIPSELKNDLALGLRGKKKSSPAVKFTKKDNTIKWLKWKLSPIITQSNTLEGLILAIEDVTHYERNNELFLKSELVSKTGSWELNLLTNELYWSPMTKIIHELPLHYTPNLEETIHYYKEGKHRKNINALINNAISKGTHWDTELIIVTAKGNKKWVRAKGEVERNHGKNVRVFGTFQDINDKKKQELKYLKTSERLKIAANAAKIGIWEFDIKTKNLVWDKNMYCLYGIEKGSFTSAYEAWEAALHENDKEQTMCNVAMAIAGEKDFDTEFRIVWPNGSIRNIRAVAHTERDIHGKGTKMIGINWDITQLIHAQSKLHQTEKSLHAALEHSKIGMAIVDTNLKWLKINKSLCDSLGYKVDELLKLTILDITHPDDRGKSSYFHNNAVNTNSDAYQLEKRYLHKQGHIVHVLVSVNIVKDMYGNPSHSIAQVLDLTDRIASKNRLESLVEITKEQNASLTNFAHIVSHNLRSHASNLSMLTKFMQEENDNKELKNLSSMMINAVGSLDETIFHLNEVVQVKTSALEKMQRVNVLSTINSTEKSIKGILREKEAITKILVKSTDYVRAVPAYLESIFLNLYTNSLKYCSPVRKPILEISSNTTNGIISIVFKDNGMGINMKRYGDKIFGMYKTFHKHKDAKGIGLFITKNQIEAMGGTITVESDVDKGTAFTITLKQDS